MVLKSYWTYRKGRVRAFTLLESLIALVVISGSGSCLLTNWNQNWSIVILKKWTRIEFI